MEAARTVGVMQIRKYSDHGGRETTPGPAISPVVPNSDAAITSTKYIISSLVRREQEEQSLLSEENVRATATRVSALATGRCRRRIREMAFFASSVTLCTHRAGRKPRA